MLAENIERSLSNYFSSNIDKYGMACVSRVILSPDARSALVFLRSNVDQRQCMDAIKEDRREIGNFMTKYFKVKSLPRLKYFFDETKDF